MPTAVPTPGMAGRKITVGTRVFDAPEFADFEELKKEHKALAKQLDSDDLEEERRAFNRAQDPKQTLNSRQTALAQKYAEKVALLTDMQGQIVLGKQKFRPQAGSTNAAPKRRIWNQKTGRLE